MAGLGQEARGRGAVIAAGTLFGVWSDSFRHKILYDEFVIQGTAYVMHATKQVSTVLRAYNIFGTWLPIDFYLDKRPYFFPFLVSLLHDLTGYRVANMFALNVACAAMLLALLYWFAREVAGRPAALFAVGLFSLMPLFGQNATGAGMDLHNLTMIALVACLAVLYLRVPSDDRLSLFVLGAVLLTQSRYESILFVAPAAFLVAARLVPAPEGPSFRWPAIVAPLLLVPYAWHSRVLASEPVFWQLEKGQTSAFALVQRLQQLQGRHLEFLFNTGPGMANSAYLSVVGAPRPCLVLLRRRRVAPSRPRPLSPGAPVLVGAAFGAGIATHFVVLLFYWWAKFNDLMAARFALPMCLAFAVLASGACQGAHRPAPPRRRRSRGGASASGSSRWGCRRSPVKFYTDENLGHAGARLGAQRRRFEARPRALSSRTSRQSRSCSGTSRRSSTPSPHSRATTSATTWGLAPSGRSSSLRPSARSRGTGAWASTRTTFFPRPSTSR